MLPLLSFLVCGTAKILMFGQVATPPKLWTNKYFYFFINQQTFPPFSHDFTK